MLTTQRPHPHSDRPSAIWFHLGALLTVTAWGISFVSTKILLDNGLRPAEIYVYRFVLAYLIVFCACHKKIWSNSWRDELLFMTCGLCAGSIYFIAENTALEYTLVSNVSLITSVSPLLTAIMVGAIYKSERPSKGTLIGSLVAFIGVACVIFNSSFVIKMNPLGDMLSLLAAFSWAIYSLVLRRLNALYTVMFITRKTFFYGVVTAIPFMLLEPTDTTPSVLLRTEVWSNLLFLGVFASMLAYLIWAQAIKYLGAIKASNYLYVQPIITLVASVLLIGENITVVGYIGCTLILLGVWLGDKLTQISSKRR
ncbi:MAG: DMT family transporter [Muribaculaceae bacterium]|nr:DMT family transporter [Muribaculaceae bacterium]